MVAFILDLSIADDSMEKNDSSQHAIFHNIGQKTRTLKSVLEAPGGLFWYPYKFAEGFVNQFLYT